LEYDDATPLNNVHRAAVLLDDDGTLYFNEAANGGWDGVTITGIRVKMITGFGVAQYKPVEIFDKCSSANYQANLGTAMGDDFYTVSINRYTDSPTTINLAAFIATIDDNRVDDCTLTDGTAYRLVTDASGDDNDYAGSGMVAI
jgi:hypothetical protein